VGLLVAYAALSVEQPSTAALREKSRAGVRKDDAALPRGRSGAKPLQVADRRPSIAHPYASLESQESNLHRASIRNPAHDAQTRM